jgi:hypothetical protein
LAAGALVGVTGAVAAAADGQVRAWAVVNCAGNHVDLTVDNQTDAPVEVTVSRSSWYDPAIEEEQIFEPIPVDAGATVNRQLGPLPWEASTLAWHFWLGPQADGKFLAGANVFPCAAEYNPQVTARSGIPVEIAFCSPVGHGPARHGTVEVPPNGGTGSLVYTANHGYIGPDQFTYGCGGAGAAFGTVFVTVLPGLAAPAPPRATPPRTAPAPPRADRPRTVPAPPRAAPVRRVGQPAAALPATGAPAGAQVGVGAALVGLGTLVLLLGRRRRCRVIR